MLLKYFLLLLSFVVFLGACSKSGHVDSKNENTHLVETPQDIKNTDLIQSDPPNFNSIFRQNTASVVTISASSVQQLPNAKLNSFNSHGDLIRKSLGSGFIISSDGEIITSAHVVYGATKISVILDNNQELEANIIGIDSATDIALLKIETAGLKIVKLANKLPAVGEWVVAIGSPYGFMHSLTSGVVSSVGRSIPSISSDTGITFLQTDVPINPGSSGSPLFNLSGEVVGMNSLIYSPDPTYNGISFALPIDFVVKEVDVLKSRYFLTSFFLKRGIELMPIKNQFLKKMNLNYGLIIKDLGDKSYSLIVGDIVLEINNIPVNDIDKINKTLIAKSSQNTFLILRNNQHFLITID